MIRDRKYLDWLRTQRCIFTGLSANEFEAVDPMHIGTAGKGLKSSDDEALPVSHSIHREAHQYGEMTVIREELPNDVLRAALRAYAREMYAKWKGEHPTPEVQPRKKAKAKKSSLAKPKKKIPSKPFDKTHKRTIRRGTVLREDAA